MFYLCDYVHLRVLCGVDCLKARAHFAPFSPGHVCNLPGINMVSPDKHVLHSVFVAVLLLFNTAHSGDPFAVTSVGVIQGTEESTPDGHLYFAFRGIPYARPPTGDLRWKLPQPLPEFQSIYEAKDFKPGCPQLTTKVTTSEDCLFLDIYVPHNVSGLYDNVTNAVEAWEKKDNVTSGW